MSADESLAEHPMVALGVSTATTAGGALTFVAQVQSWVTVTSLCVGLLMSLVLLRNHIIKGRALAKEDRLLELELERAEREEREAHGHQEDHQG